MLDMGTFLRQNLIIRDYQCCGEEPFARRLIVEGVPRCKNMPGGYLFYWV